MHMSRVTEVELPPDSLIARAFDRVDYADAFHIALPVDDRGVDDVLRASFAAMPGWMSGLLRARDAAMRPFGLRPAGGAGARVPERFEVGDAMGLFRVHARSEREIVVGEDDRHLDFRASFLRESERDLVVSTVVAYRNALGRAYFAVVGPGHRVIVPALMRATARALAR